MRREKMWALIHRFLTETAAIHEVSRPLEQIDRLQKEGQDRVSAASQQAHTGFLNRPTHASRDPISFSEVICFVREFLLLHQAVQQLGMLPLGLVRLSSLSLSLSLISKSMSNTFTPT